MDDAESLNDRVASEVRAWIGRRQTTGRKVAAKIGKSQTWVSSRTRGETEISLNDLQLFAAALEVEVTDLLPTTPVNPRLTASYPLAVVGASPAHPSGHVIRADRHPHTSATQPSRTGSAPVVHHRPARLSRPRTRPADAA